MRGESPNKIEKIIKTMNLEARYFNSFLKLKYLPEWKNKEINAIPNEILSIHKSDLNKAMFKSLIFKDINTNIREKMNNNNNTDFIKIPKVRLIG